MRQSHSLPLLVILFVFLIGVFTSCCPAKKVDMAIALQPQISSISGDSYGDADKKLFGFALGFELGLPLFPCDQPGGLAFMPGLQFSSQGGNYKEYNNLEGKIVTSYIQLPLLARYNTDGGFYAELGLQPGVLIAAKDKYDGNSDDFKSYLKGFDLGLPVGIGYKFKSGFGLGIRVTPGLSNIDKEKGDPDDQPNKNFVAGLRIGYTFPSKKK